MITLITGGPGLGKTALVVSMLLEEYAGRTIFSNIKGLTLEHSPLPRLEEWTKEVTNDQGTSEYVFTFPPGSVVVIDECQNFYRPRASGSKVPPHVQAGETHRHTGVDFVLMTQGTRLVDFNLRSLVKGGRHIHLHQSFFKRYRLERNECIDEDDKASRALASWRKYTLPKHVFPLYKSSELHTKPPRAKLPMQAYVLIGSIILLLVGGGYFYTRMDAKFNPVADMPADDAGTAQPALGRMVAVSNRAPERMMEALMLADDENHLSAALYADSVPPVVPPEIQGCISSARSCACYSQQQTPVWVPEPQCRDRAAGKYYDPYRQAVQVRDNGANPQKMHPVKQNPEIL